MELEGPPPAYTAKAKKIRAPAIVLEPPPPYNVEVVAPITTIRVQPNVTVTIDENNKHLCMCERGCGKIINCCFCLPNDIDMDNRRNPSCKDLKDFRVYCGSDDDGYCLGFLCFPVTLVRKLIYEVPCVTYNTCRNMCNGTKGLNYMC
jgi:hypothetical protein